MEKLKVNWRNRECFNDDKTEYALGMSCINDSEFFYIGHGTWTVNYTKDSPVDEWLMFDGVDNFYYQHFSRHNYVTAYASSGLAILLDTQAVKGYIKIEEIDDALIWSEINNPLDLIRSPVYFLKVNLGLNKYYKLFRPHAHYDFGDATSFYSNKKTIKIPVNEATHICRLTDEEIK